MGVELYLVVSPEMTQLYNDAAEKYNSKELEERDSGFDLYCDSDYIVTKQSQFLKFGVLRACAMKHGSELVNRAYWLMPRSSISKTNVVCSNSKGLIDSGYRGNLMGAVRTVGDIESEAVSARTRLFQLVSGSAKPWARVHIVDELPKPDSYRGTGGFGSTGKGADI
jgi:dUTP pyrophosphatase